MKTIKVTKRPKIGCVVRATGKALRFFSAVLFVTATMSMTACSADLEPEIPVDDVPVVNVPSLNTLHLEPEELALVESLVEMSLWCQDMNDDYREFNERAWEMACDKEHHCVSCKVYALKYFSEHDVFYDTTAESCKWDTFQELLENRPDFKYVFDNLKL